MKDMYIANGLCSHPDKEEVNATDLTSWGARCLGVTGWVSCPTSRIIYLTAFTVEVVRLGVATVALLESLGGSWVAVLMVKRRLLSVMDLIFEAGRGRSQNSVLRLSAELKTELLGLALVAPLAVADLRTKAADKIYMVDASSKKYAAVSAPVSPLIAQELTRRCPRKARWAKLMGRAQAWKREHGLLGEHEELPGGRLETSPVFETAATGLTYKLEEVHDAPRREHVNMSELRAILLAETVAAQDKPNQRPLIGGTRKWRAL